MYVCTVMYVFIQVVRVPMKRSGGGVTGPSSDSGPVDFLCSKGPGAEWIDQIGILPDCHTILLGWWMDPYYYWYDNLCMYICLHVFMCKYVCMYVCMYVRMYVCIIRYWILKKTKKIEYSMTSVWNICMYLFMCICVYIVSVIIRVFFSFKNSIIIS